MNKISTTQRWRGRTATNAPDAVLRDSTVFRDAQSINSLLRPFERHAVRRSAHTHAPKLPSDEAPSLPRTFTFAEAAAEWFDLMLRVA